MKQKYIEESFPRWFVFGEGPRGVDVSDGSRDVAAGVSAEAAKALIEDRNRILDCLIALAQALNDENPDLFGVVWYGAEGVGGFGRKEPTR